MNFNNFKIKLLEKKEILFLLGCVALVVVCVAFFTWGKMQMGDSSVELTYGTMVKAGRIPYADFYMHIMPLTSYIASFLLMFDSPIHAANFLGVINVLAASLVVLVSVYILRLSFYEKILSTVVFLGVYLGTLPSFNHHSFDLTLSASVTLFIIFLIKATARRSIIIWAGMTALFSVSNFFVTQTYGLASMALGFFVLLADFILNKNKISVYKMYVLASIQVLCLVLFLGGFSVFGKIPLQKMYESTFATGYQQYTGTYGYGTIWRTSVANILSFYNKRVAPVQSTVQTDAVISGVSSDLEKEFLLPEGLFYKIFLKKSSFLFSLFSLFGLMFIIQMALYALVVFFKKIKHKEFVDPIFLLWVGTIGIFFVSSILVFQMNFSLFFMVFILWLYGIKQNHGTFLSKFNGLVNMTAGGLAVLLLISNITILHVDFKTRDYLMSKTKNENVWVPTSYFKSFATQFRQVSSFLSAEPYADNLSAYPRASEVYYLLGRIPPVGFPLVSFYRPGGAYNATVEGAKNSDTVVIFEPKFYGSDLGEEHAFAMKQIQPALDEYFVLSFNSLYFKIYKHL